MLQVFALLGGQQIGVKTLLCDTPGLAETTFDKRAGSREKPTGSILDIQTMKAALNGSNAIAPAA